MNAIRTKIGLRKSAWQTINWGYSGIRSDDRGPNNTRYLLLFGRAGGLPWDQEMAAVADTVIAHESGDSFDSVQWIGDLDGDGIEDLFLHHDGAYGGVWDAGAIFVFTGRPTWPGHLLTTEADVRFAGNQVYQSMRHIDWSLVDDLNGDGIDDLATASPYHPLGTEEGETFVFYGQPRP